MQISLVFSKQNAKIFPFVSENIFLLFYSIFIVYFCYLLLNEKGMGFFFWKNVLASKGKKGIIIVVNKVESSSHELAGLPKEIGPTATTKVSVRGNCPRYFITWRRKILYLTTTITIVVQKKDAIQSMRTCVIRKFA